MIVKNFRSITVSIFNRSSIGPCFVCYYCVLSCSVLLCFVMVSEEIGTIQASSSSFSNHAFLDTVVNLCEIYCVEV